MLSIPSLPETGNGFDGFKLFPSSLPCNHGMAFAKTILSHPRPPKPWNAFRQNKLLPPSVPRNSAPFPLGSPFGGRCPVRRTPRAMNSRCRRRATPSEGGAYRSEPVERSRMRPREGERSPRAYSEEQGQRLRQVNLGEGRASGARGRARVWVAGMGAPLGGSACI